MGKTHRFDPRDADDYSEPMRLELYTAESDETTTATAADVTELSVVEVIPGCDRVCVGDVYRRAEAGTVTEAWVTGPGDDKGEFLALVTVQRGKVQIAARLLSLPETFLAGMVLSDYQAVSDEEPERIEVINATG